MKILIRILFLLLIGVSVKGQSNPSGFPTQNSTGWFRHGWDQSDSGTIFAPRIPNFTPRFPGTTILYQQNGIDTSLNYWTGGRWIKINASQFDSTYLSNRINLKLNISDTASMLLPYLRKVDTTNRWIQNVYARNDSLFKLKNGIETFVHVFPTAGSGTVTSVGLSLPASMSVTPSTITSSGVFNVSGAGSSSQYVKGDFTLGTTDTSMIPNFYLKVRSLLSGTSPITYNSTTGAIGITNANTSGTKGAATFSSSSFSDNGSGLIALNNLVSSGSCINCQFNVGTDGRITSYASGTVPIVVNAPGAGDTLIITGDTIKRLNPGYGMLHSVTQYSITESVDTTLIQKIIIANNGLTKIGSNIQLGGTLIQTTSINNGSNLFSMTGTNTSETFSLSNTSTGKGILVSAIDNNAVDASSTNASAVSAVSTNGEAISATSTNNAAGQFSVNPSNTNSIIDNVLLTRATTGTAANGEGQAIVFYNQLASGSALIANRIVSKQTNVVDANRTSALEFYGTNNNVYGLKASLSGSGQWNWPGYPSLTAQTDSTTYKPLAYDASGNIVPMANWVGGGGTTLNNIGSGYRWVATAGGDIKTSNPGYGILQDSSTLSNTITSKIDTNTTDSRYERVYSITDARFAGGAIADGMENRTASMTSGSAVLTCTTCSFTANDVGKWIRVYRAATSQQDMVTTISGFTNSTTVTLGATASTSVSADTVIYGTDNVPSIQAALNYADAQGGNARVVIPPPGAGKFYVLAGTLNHSGSDCNCQINFPISDISDVSFNHRKNIVLDGVVGPNYTPSALFADTLTPKYNTTLVSIIHGSGIRASVFAAKANSFLYANYINYNLITVKNLELLVERNRTGGGPDIGGFNFYNASSSPMENVVISWNGPIHGTTEPTNEVAGLIVGQLSSEIYTTLKNVSIFGFKFGLVTTESVSLDHVIAHACANGITLIHGNYPVVGTYVDAHWCKNSLYVPASTILGDIAPGITYFNFQFMPVEIFNGSGLGAPAWLDYTNVVSDSSSYGRGSLIYEVGHAEVGIDNSMFKKYGGDSIFCYQVGSAIDRNPHIYAGLTEYAGWQNGGLTNYWYNWSPLNDVSIMRLSPTTAGSQALYLSPNSTGGTGGVPKAWINIFNTAFWTGVNTTSTNTEVMQLSANGSSGYNINSSSSGSGTTRDINIGTGSNITQLKVQADGTVSLNASSINDMLKVNGNSTARASIIATNSNATGSTTVYTQNDGGFNSYGGILQGGSSDAGSNLFGITRANKTFFIHDGTSGLGMGIGTLQSTPIVFGTNNSERMRLSGAGALSIQSLTLPPSTYNVLVHGLTDSVVYQVPLSSLSGITSINSQTGPSITMAATNGLSVANTTNTVTYSLGGTLTGTTTINGASNSLNLGASGNTLSALSVWSGGRINLFGQTLYGVDVYSADADHTMAANVTFEELSANSLTADRTLTLPTAIANGQTIKVITLYDNVSAFHYNLSSAVTDNATGTTFTQLAWGKTYTFYVDASIGGWRLIDKY